MFIIDQLVLRAKNAVQMVQEKIQQVMTLHFIRRQTRVYIHNLITIRANHCLLIRSVSGGYSKAFLIFKPKYDPENTCGSYLLCALCGQRGCLVLLLNIVHVL
jgi:hypothetical protein